MPFNNSQVEKIPKDLDLRYYWTNPSKGANTIIVEDILEYKPFSNKLLDTRTNESMIFNTYDEFKKRCEDIKKNKPKIIKNFE